LLTKIPEKSQSSQDPKKVIEKLSFHGL
jgi:hypothetical protein